MSHPGTPRAVLKRGALVTAANWPVVLIQFVTDATVKLLLAVPVVGGAVLVALSLERDLAELLGGDLRDIISAVGTALVEQPVAFLCFLLALAVSLGSGAALALLVKGGTVTVLVEGERHAGDLEHLPVRLATLARASAYSTGLFLAGCRRLFRRYIRLALLLAGVYVVSAGLYLVGVWAGFRVVPETRGSMAWAVLAALWSAALVAWITLVNLFYLLLQLTMAVEGCGVRRAVWHVARLLRARGRDVAVVFLLLLGLVVLATVASVIATTGLGLISFVPLVGLAVFPLQTLAWLVRGLVFQYLGLTALSAYVTLYRTAPAAVVAGSPATLRTAS